MDPKETSTTEQAMTITSTLLVLRALMPAGFVQLLRTRQSACDPKFHHRDHSKTHS
jgi:hypothetical protein